MRSSGSAFRPLAFGVASLALHAAALIGWETSTDRPLLHASDHAVLIVSIEAPPARRPAAIPPSPTSAAAEQPKQETSTTERAVANPALDTKEPVDTERRGGADAPVSTTAPADAAGADMRNWLRARVAGELSRYFTYPSLARQRGLSGTVVLAYRIESDGRLEDIMVARSSGYALLDRSAISDLGRVPPLTDAMPRLGGIAVEETVAVIYRLREN